MSNEDLSKQLETAISAVKTAQARNDEVDKRIIGQDDAVEKARTVAMDAMDAVQKIHAETKAIADAQAEELKILKAKLVRSVSANGTDELIENSQYAKEFNRYLRKGIAITSEVVEAVCDEMANKSVFGLEPEKLAVFKKDLVEGSNPDGGYFVIPQRSSQRVTRVFETSPMRMIANVVNTTSDALEMIIDDEEEEALSVGETSARPTTATGQIGLLVIPVNEIYANPRATQRMIDDAGFNIEAWLQMKVDSRITRKENTQFVRGNSAGEARGFLTLPNAPTVNTYARGQIGTRVTAGSLTISGDDIKLLQSDLKEAYQGSAVWLMKRATWGFITTLKDAVNGTYLLPNFFLVDQANLALLGKRVIFADDMDTMVANGYAVAYGDFGMGYTIVDRTGLRVLRDPYTDKPYIHYYTTKRTGGDVTSYDSFKRLQVKS